MERFAQLFAELDTLSEASARLLALEGYFREAPRADAAWGLWFMLGRRIKTGISSNRLRQWTLELSTYPDWLVEACHKRVGDLSESASLLLPLAPVRSACPPLRELVEEHLMPLANWDEHFQLQILKETLLGLEAGQVLVLSKLLTGTFRPGVTRFEVARSLSRVLDVGYPILLHRLSEPWLPTEGLMDSLADPEANAEVAKTCPTLLVETPPLVADLVLIYAQTGSGSLSGGYRNYTLAASTESGFVPVAKATSELSAGETRELGLWIDQHIQSKRGPVHTTPAELVFTVEFDGVYASPRHKSGLFIDNPRICRWRRDLRPDEITPVDSLRAQIRNDRH